MPDREQCAPELDLRSQPDKEPVHYPNKEVVHRPDRQAVYYPDRGAADDLDKEVAHHPEKEAAYADVKQYAGSSRPERKLCGMRPRIAFGIFAIMGLAVVGAIVGGAVGGTRASSEHTSSSATSASSSPATSATSSAATSATPIGPGEGTYTCPESNHKNYITSPRTGNLTFLQLCDVEWSPGEAAISQTTTGTVQDISMSTEYSLASCIEQCATYSLSNTPKCLAVVYTANITAAETHGAGQNCLMLNSRGAENYGSGGPVQAAYMIGK